MAVKRAGGGGYTDGRMSGGRKNIKRGKEFSEQPGRHGGGGYVPKNQYTGGGGRQTLKVEARQRSGGRVDPFDRYRGAFDKGFNK